MARRPELLETTAQIIDADADDVSQIVEDDANEEDDLASEFGNADGDTRLSFKVHKYVPNSKDMIYCMDGTAADMPIIPKLQEGWGEGKYRIQLFKNGKFARRWTVAVAPLPRFGKTETATAPGGNDPRVIALLERLVERQSETPKQSLGAMDIVAIIGAAAPAILAMKELFAQPPQPNQLDMLKTAVELMQTVQGPGSDREPSIVEVIGNVLTKTDLLGNLGQLVAPQAQQPQQPQRPQIPGQVRATPTPEQIQQATMAQLATQIQYLVSRAQKGSDPGLYAEVILDTFDPGLIHQFAAPGAIEYIVTLHPPAAQFRPWFEALLTALIELRQDNQAADGEAFAAVNDNDFDAQAEPHPVPAQSAPHTNVFDPLGNGGNAGDFAFDGETS